MKIRMDFVTNSSSSSFVCFGVFSEELKEYVEQLINEGKAREKAEYKNFRLFGEEACSYLFYKDEGVFTYQQLYSDFSPITDRSLDIFSANLEENFWYTPEMEQSDKKKILKYPKNASNSIESFFNNLSTEQSRKLQALVNNAAKDKNIGCSVFMGATDSDPSIDIPVSEIKRDCQAMKEKEAKKAQKAKESRSKYTAAGKKTAAPAVGELSNSNAKKSWRFEEKEDGTLRLLGYKGIATDVSVPSKIAGACVSEIGEDTFNPRQKRVQSEDKAARQAIVSIAVHEKIDIIENCAFAWCQGLTGINVSDDNKNYTSADGVLFNKEKTELIQYPAGNKSAKYSIPDSVKRIWQLSFAGNRSLVELSIPSSVTRIEHGAFSECNRLKSITIPESITSIEESTFDGCSSLTDITIPESVKGIGESAFSQCKALEILEIPESVKSIEQYTFYGCRNLTSIVIPNNVTSIGRFAFSNCEKLENITIPNSVKIIGESAFSNCETIKRIIIPESVTSIEQYMFDGCSSLTDITIPESVTSIGQYAFGDCDKLTIHAPAGSCAERYAKENNISYVAE